MSFENSSDTIEAIISLNIKNLFTSRWGREIDTSSSQATSCSMTLIMLYQKDKGTSLKIFFLGLLDHKAVLFPVFFKESPHCSP